MKKRLIILSTIAAIIIVFLVVSYYLKDQKAESIVTTGIVKGTEVNLTSKISGKISELCCGESNPVQAGSVAVRLDNDDLEAAVEQAKASIERAIADIQTSAANIEVAKAQMDKAKRELERTTALYKEELASQADFDLAVTSFNSAKATYKASTSKLISAKAKLREAEAMLSLQEAKLNDSIIITPISGVVVFRALETGEFVSPGVTILTIVDMDNLWVRIDIEETLVGYIGLGSEALVSIDSMPEKILKGNVSEIGRYAEFATQKDVKHGKQDIKTFHVEIKLKDPEKILKPGMTVNVEIPIERGK